MDSCFSFNRVGHHCNPLQWEAASRTIQSRGKNAALEHIHHTITRLADQLMIDDEIIKLCFFVQPAQLHLDDFDVSLTLWVWVYIHKSLSPLGPVLHSADYRCINTWVHFIYIVINLLTKYLCAREFPACNTAQPDVPDHPVITGDKVNTNLHAHTNAHQLYVTCPNNEIIEFQSRTPSLIQLAIALLPSAPWDAGLIW